VPGLGERAHHIVGPLLAAQGQQHQEAAVQLIEARRKAGSIGVAEVVVLLFP